MGIDNKQEEHKEPVAAKEPIISSPPIEHVADNIRLDTRVSMGPSTSVVNQHQNTDNYDRKIEQRSRMCYTCPI